MQPLQPLIEQRADPFIHRHADGWYTFTASVPAYDGVELRRSRTITGLTEAEPVMVWRRPERGLTCGLIWAPEIHFIDGRWVVYFAASRTRDITNDPHRHRMFAITSDGDDDPLEGPWSEPIQIETGLDTFCLDATTFEHRGARYYAWAQQDPAIRGNSNLYIAPISSATELAGQPVRLSVPEFEWERRGYWVNEGPAVVKHGSRLWMTYSASATDENYAMGLLWADADADPLDPASWTKSPEPVLTSRPELSLFGPGHNSFTVAEDGRTDLLVYHARTTHKIIGDPLWDPGRHTFVQPLRWGDDGMPEFHPDRLSVSASR